MADFTRIDVAHLLRRAGFFASPTEVDDLAGEPSWEAVVARVLDASANPPDPGPPMPPLGENPRVRDIVAGVGYWIDRMATTPTPIVEKMTFFWHGVLASALPNPNIRMMVKQIQTYRSLALGDVHDLLQAMAIDPAMLRYLDNGTNVKAAPNENFARELMELFTMGNGTFTEAEVVDMARAWTGHNSIYALETYTYRPNQHDNGAKTLFGITKNWDGPEALTEIVRGVRQPVCARYLAGRVWSFLASPNPPAPLIDDLASAFIASGMDTSALVRAVLLRPEFRTATTRTALVRSPVEWVVATMRATGLTAAQLDLQDHLQELGQVPYWPPNVSGWRQNRAWISSSAQWAKGSLAGVVRERTAAAGTFDAWADLAVPDAVGAALARFGVDDPSSATRQRLEAHLAAERSAGRGAAAPATIAALILLSPDFQLA